MRPEGSPLDLNHLPEDFTRDGKQGFEDPSTSGQRKKKNNGKDESEKVYECRFCSLKFCKSQALGGHMNRHRQERETETLNKARQLVYNTDNSAAHLGPYVAPSATAYHPHPHPHHQPPPPPHHVYPTRSLMFSGTMHQSPSSDYPHRHHHHHHHQSYAYMSTSPRLVSPGGDYYMAHGHALTGTSPTSTYNCNNDPGGANNYTCIGVPVGLHGLGPAGRDGLESREEGGVTSSWGRSYVSSSSVGSEQHHLDSPY